MSLAAVVPDRGTALALLEEYDVVPLVRELPTAGRTPVDVMRALGVEGRCFLLESAQQGGSIGGHSYLCHEPASVAPRDDDDPLRPLQAVDAESVAPVEGLAGVFSGGWVGYLAYEAARCYERLPQPDADPLGLPIADFALYRSVVVFDHARSCIFVSAQLTRRGDYDSAVRRIDELTRTVESVAAASAPPPDPAPASVRPRDLDEHSSFARQAFVESVERCLDHIVAGDIFQVQISRRYSLPLAMQPFEVYEMLRRLNPSPYLFYVSTPRCVLAGASPETLVRVRGGEVTYRPIAGTRRRGRDAAEDSAMEAELRSSEKEQAEHLMLVDLGRNDLGRVAATGTVRVGESMVVERYSHVMHLVSGISARLDAGRTALDALRATFPAGTVTGAPKIRAMEIIAAEEPHQRGPYAGAVGYVGSGGLLDMAIALRTVVIVDGVAHLQAAAGIVADSDPLEEAREIDNKLAAALAAVRAGQPA
ncbi:MAG: anthranilate synthase component I family protein [Candidatus Dormibacteria bacterium]